MNSIEKLIYVQSTSGNRHCAPFLTSTEIFLKNIDELDHVCMQQIRHIKKNMFNIL